MKTRELLVFSIFFLFLSSCGVDEPIQETIYPTTLEPLSSSNLNEYVTEYDSLNSGQICSELNEYGYCEYDLSPCLGRSILREEITSESEMLRMAKEFISRNSKFMGVTNVDELQVSRSLGITGCIECDGSPDDMKNIKWRIEFNNQVYNGYEVFNTEITISLDNNGVFMAGGNWYPQIDIPQNDSYDLGKAKETLYGYKVQINCRTNYEIIVSENNIGEEAKKVIFPLKKDNRIELRTAWEIYINDEYVIYVDSVTGEIIEERQIVIC